MRDLYSEHQKLTAQVWRCSFEWFFDQCVNKCVYVCQFVHIDLRNSFGKIASPVQWQSWCQLALCYYCRGCTKIFCVQMSDFKLSVNKVKINKYPFLPGRYPFLRALHLGIQFSFHPASSLYGTQQQLTHPLVETSNFSLWKNHVSQGLLS